jgi:hypothetical protein
VVVHHGVSTGQGLNMMLLAGKPCHDHLLEDLLLTGVTSRETVKLRTSYRNPWPVLSLRLRVGLGKARPRKNKLLVGLVAGQLVRRVPGGYPRAPDHGRCTLHWSLQSVSLGVHFGAADVCGIFTCQHWPPFSLSLSCHQSAKMIALKWLK